MTLQRITQTNTENNRIEWEAIYKLQNKEWHRQLASTTKNNQPDWEESKDIIQPSANKPRNLLKYFQTHFGCTSTTMSSRTITERELNLIAFSTKR